MNEERGDLAELLDQRDIRALSYRYAHALDEKNWELLATCFNADAVALYGEALGRQDGVAAIQKTCRKALARLDSSQHIITNHEIEIAGDNATLRCYVHAQHTKSHTEGGDNLTIGGIYLAQLVRSEEGWRIQHFELRMLWQEGNPAVLG